MKRLFLIVIPIFLVSCSVSKGQESLNRDLEHQVIATIWFQSSPEASALYHQGFNLAKERVVEFSGQKGNKPKAVVVDIDETMVSNAMFQGKAIERGVAYTPEFWKEWSDLAIATALPGALEFTHFCDSLGVEIICISNRTVHEIEATMRNLDSLGFAFVKPENFLLKETTSGKEERREKVMEKFDIILLLGDNLNDFSDVFESRSEDWGLSVVEEYKHEFGRRFILFPNPMYGEWEKNIYGKEKNLSNDKMFKKRRAALRSY